MYVHVNVYVNVFVSANVYVSVNFSLLMCRLKYTLFNANLFIMECHLCGPLPWRVQFILNMKSLY